jgi:hypothetical protein
VVTVDQDEPGPAACQDDAVRGTEKKKKYAVRDQQLMSVGRSFNVVYIHVLDLYGCHE